MDLDNLKMFTCKKYRTSMLASKADATCAKRFDAARRDSSWDHNVSGFDKCLTCLRGAAMYELGKHKADEKRPAPTRGDEVPTITIHEEGETNMEYHKSCTEHGPFTVGGPRGGCPKCKEAKLQKAGTAKARGTRRKATTEIVPRISSPLVDSPSPLPGGGAVSISIDLARFPKLHGRLISLGINTILAEMEIKA